MPQRPYVIDEMISAKAIAARVEALAKEITHAFRDTDKLVVVGLFTDDIYTPEGLATLDQLTREAAAAPWVHRVISLTTLEVARDEGGAMEVTPLVPKGALGDAEIAALRRATPPSTLATALAAARL